MAVFTLFVTPLSGSVRAMAFLLPLMPTSLSTLLYSAEQNLNPRLAAMLVSLTMVVSLVITTVTVLGFRHAPTNVRARARRLPCSSNIVGR